MPKPSVQAQQRARDRVAVEVMLRIRRDRRRATGRIAQMLGYIERHLFVPEANVTTMRRACGITDNAMAIRFHHEMGETPKHYITARRMETASRLLLETNLKIWQIGVLVGYSTIGVFSKAFYRCSGQRPQAFRTQRQTDPLPGPGPDMCRKALAGELDEGEALEFLAYLTRLYPTAGQTPSDKAAEP